MCCVDLWTQTFYKTARNPALQPNPMRFSSLLIVAITAVCFYVSVEAAPTDVEPIHDPVAPTAAQRASSTVPEAAARVVPKDDYTFELMEFDLKRMLAFIATHKDGRRYEGQGRIAGYFQNGQADYKNDLTHAGKLPEPINSQAYLDAEQEAKDVSMGTYSPLNTPYTANTLGGP